MTVNSIAQALATLTRAVKPTSNAAIDPALHLGSKLESKVNTFALAVLTDVLEGQQSLLDGSNHDKDVNNVVGIAAYADAQANIKQQTADLTSIQGSILV